MRTEINGDRFNMDFDSMDDMVETIKKHDKIVDLRNESMRGDKSFYGVSRMEQAFSRAINGVPRDGIEAMDIANKRVSTLERDIDMPAFSSFYDVSGADVDVARFLSGEPENMINYHMVDTPRAGRIISVAVAVATSCVTEVEAIRARGMEIAALVFAIEKIGFQVELWADLLVNGLWGRGDGKSLRIRTKIKASGEVLDPGQMVYAFTDASYLRCLGFAAMHLTPSSWHSPLGVGYGYGRPSRGLDDMREYPEGTVFIPSFEGDPKEAANLVTEKLKELGLI